MKNVEKSEEIIGTESLLMMGGDDGLSDEGQSNSASGSGSASPSASPSASSSVSNS